MKWKSFQVTTSWHSLREHQVKFIISHMFIYNFDAFSHHHHFRARKINIHWSIKFWVVVKINTTLTNFTRMFFFITVKQTEKKSIKRNNDPAAKEGAVRRSAINTVVTFVFLLNIRFFWGFFLHDPYLKLVQSPHCLCSCGFFTVN